MGEQTTDYGASIIVVTSVPPPFAAEFYKTLATESCRRLVRKEDQEFLGLFHIAGVRFSVAQLNQALAILTPLIDKLWTDREHSLAMRLALTTASSERVDIECAGAHAHTADEWTTIADEAMTAAQAIEQHLNTVTCMRDGVLYLEKAMTVGSAALGALAEYQKKR